MSAPAAIILAAGEGRRMGGPKALLVIDGQSLLRRHVERLREVGCAPVVVVVPVRELEPVRQLLGESSDVTLVAADTPSMAASLALGLEHVPPKDGAVVVSPVDALPARPATLRALITAAEEAGVEVATPSYGGRGGHPVVARERLLRAFRQGYSGTLRDLIRGAGAKRRRLEVDDAAVGHDLDTPADLAALRPDFSPNQAAED